MLLDTRAEQNLPTWFTVVLLTLGAVAHALVGALSRACARPSAPWFASSALLAVLSLDEVAALHEQLEKVGRRLGGGDGALHFAWLVPGLLIAAVLLLVTWKLYRRLPAPSGPTFLLGIILFMVAAVGLEALGGAILAGPGDGALYILVSHFEELLETAAACLLLLAAMLAIRLDQLGAGGVAVALTDSGPAAGSRAGAGRA